MKCFRRQSIMNISWMTECLRTRVAHRAICLVAGMIIVLSQLALGQGAVGGRITGRVTDPTGAVIPDAMISAENTSTNIVTKAKSNESGYYVIQVPEGKYTLT